jgi:hypothetical protein
MTIALTTLAMTLAQSPHPCSVGGGTTLTPFVLSEVEAHLSRGTPFDFAQGERGDVE